MSANRKLRVTEAAICLGSPVRSVRRWCERGTIPAEKVGGQWWIRVSVLRRRWPGVMADFEAEAG